MMENAVGETQMIRAFTLRYHGIDEVARRLGDLYGGVIIAKDPMFAWVQIVNDVTILGEELRRNRLSEGAARAAKVLFRLLEFLGYYLYTHRDTGENEFADAVAFDLRRRSYRKLFLNGPREGPTRWILAKYPRACSKCGQKPCHCLRWPWVVEERRDKPGPYEKRFRKDAEKARVKLKSQKSVNLPLSAMLRMFEEIYKNSYYNQEPWKVGMHLSEELGEATIELSRLELAYRGRRLEFDLNRELPKVFKQVTQKLKKEKERLSTEKSNESEKRKKSLDRDFKDERSAFKNGDAWEEFRKRVAEKFKEEVADVFSWLSAVLVRLDPERSVLEKQVGRFVFESEGIDYLKCAWCGKPECKDGCLVSHGVSSEMVEKITKF